MIKACLKITAVAAIAAVVLGSCNKGKIIMNDKIEVYEVEPLDPKAEVAPITLVELNILGGKSRLVVKTNLDYTVEFQKALTDTVNWFSFEELGYDAALGGNVIEYSYIPMTTTLSRRSGVLSFSCPGKSVGTFVTIRQGFSARHSNTWSWLKYGNEDPTVEGGTRLISQWNATQKEYGYTSTVIEGQEEAYCYGRNHLVQLGSSDGYGADLISPYVESIASDSLVVVAFKAFAYTDASGVTDNGKVTLEILGGAVFNDIQGSTVTFNVGTYSSTNAVEDIEKAKTYYYFVKTPSGKYMPSGTKFRIVAGDMGKMAKPNRIIIDNFYIYQVHASYYPYFLKTDAE